MMVRRENRDEIETCVAHRNLSKALTRAKEDSRAVEGRFSSSCSIAKVFDDQTIQMKSFCPANNLHVLLAFSLGLRNIGSDYGIARLQLFSAIIFTHKENSGNDRDLNAKKPLIRSRD
jgi:hypothetical protein